MHLDLVPPQVTQIPPWKLELLSRRSALSRTVEPKLNGVRLNPVPEQSASSESNVKVPPKCFTSWKELKDGASVAHTYSINNSQRPLSSEARRSHHPQVAVTCATLFNGDGAFKSSSNSSGEPVVVEEEGGASKRSSPAASTSTRPTSTGAPLSPVSSLDWSQSAGSPAAAAALSVAGGGPGAAGWPAHRPSRCSSLDFRTSSAVNPTQPFNRDQAPALAHHKNQAQIAKVAQIENDPGNALLAKRNLDDPGSPAPTDHRPSFVTKGHLRPAAGKLKMGEDNASAAFVEKAQDQAAASSCGGASSDEIGLDSDSSSDELHYGPGFVSRLKSRYMSAALRSSTTANAGGLRRTASLEDFLDKDKEEVSIELINVHQPKVTTQQGQGRYQRKDERTSRRTAAGSGANSVVGVASQVNRKARESIKRCQSVEVLARNKLEDSKPPPLPPKSTPTLTSASTVESVLNSEALSNDKIQLTEKSATTSSSVPPPPPPVKTASTLTEREKKKLQQPAAVASEASSTVIASLRRPFHGRRRSAGLLFGVVEKELPKTGVVDSTRKIFESRPSAGGDLGLSSAASATGLQSRLLIKSRSTSSLYGRNPSSSPVRRTLRQQSTDNNQQAPVSSSKKKDLHSLPSTKPRTASPAKTSKSLVNSSSSKPALPAKPELKTTSSKNKYHNTTSNIGAEATNVATPSKSRNKNKFEVPPLRHIDKNHRQDWNKTTPVSNKTNSSSNNNGTAIDIEEGIKIVSKDSIDKIRQASGESFNFNFKKKQPAMATKPYLPLKQQAPAPPPQQPPTTTQPVPPTPPPKIDTIDSSGLRDPPATPVPVGIIKPISRPVKDEPIHNKKQQQVEVQQKSRQNEAATESATAAVPPIPPPTINKQTTKPRAESPTTTLNNLINLTKQNNATNNTKNLNSSSNVNKLESSSTHDLKKEVILIDKKPLPTKPPPPKKQDSVIPQPPQPLEPILKVQSSQPRPPAVFANSNKIVTFAEDIIEAEEERLDDHTSAGTLHSEVDRNGAKENNSDEGIDYMDEDMDSNMKSNYRDSWKKRQEAETKNTMVFNFLNSQKDVTHIENDGLDLSKRKKKQHLRQLAKVSAPEQHNFS